MNVKTVSNDDKQTPIRDLVISRNGRLELELVAMGNMGRCISGFEKRELAQMILMVVQQIPMKPKKLVHQRVDDCPIYRKKSKPKNLNAHAEYGT